MRVIVTGKGGVGKTTVAGALCAALVDAGLEVIAVDADGSPNLAFNLGGGHPDELPAVANLVPPRPDDSCDSAPLSGPAIVDAYAVDTAAGVRLIQSGRIERPSQRCLCCGSHATAREVLAALPGGDRELVVADLEAGLNDLLWAKPGPGDVVVAVTDASRKSLDVTRRTLAISAELGVQRTLVVANKLRADETEAVHAALSDTEVLEIAYDPALDRSAPDGAPPLQLGALVQRVTGG